MRTSLKSSKFFSSIRLKRKPETTLNSALLILQWPGTGFESGQWSDGGLTWGARDVVSMMPGPQQPACSGSQEDVSRCPTGRMMSASHLSFVRRHCSVSRPLLFRHTQLNARFLPMPGKRQPQPERLQSEPEVMQEHSLWWNLLKLLIKVVPVASAPLKFYDHPQFLLMPRRLFFVPERNQLVLLGIGRTSVPLAVPWKCVCVCVCVSG